MSEVPQGGAVSYERGTPVACGVTGVGCGVQGVGCEGWRV